MRTGSLIGAASVALVVWGMCVAQPYYVSSDQSSELRIRWVAEHLRERVTEGRLSGGFLYGPPNLKKGISLSKESGEIARAIQTKGQGSSTWQALADLALMCLLGGYPEKAVPLLERASALPNQRASVWSDLAAAYIARFQKIGSPYDLVLALSAADRAVQSGPSNREALFNRALALEKLYLFEDAIPAWTSYAAAEDDHEWAMEGLRHLAELRQPSAAERWESVRKRLDDAVKGKSAPDLSEVVRQFPQAVRLYAEEHLLRTWGDALLAGRAVEAVRALSLARDIGRAVAARNGDLMLRDSVDAIDRAINAGATSVRLRSIVDGHREFGRGLDEFVQHHGSTATPHFENARAALKRSGSPFEAWACFYIGASLYYVSQYDQGLDVLSTLIAGLPENHYGSLAARIHWAIGLAHSLRSSVAVAQDQYQRSLALFEALGEGENEAYLHYLLSENLGDLGRQDEAWRERYKALSARSTVFNPSRLHNILFTFVDATLHGGQPGIGLYFQNAMVDLALRGKKPWEVSEALLRRSRVLSRLGQTKGLLTDLMEAREWARQIDSKDLRERVEADALLTEAELVGLISPSDTVASLTRILQVYIEKKYYPLRIQIHRLRARAYRALGNLNAAEGDLDAAIQEIEREREGLPEGELRETYLDQARAAYDEMIRFQFVERGDPPKALKYSEHARARALLDLFPGAYHRGTFALPEVQARLAPNKFLVEFAVIDDHIYSWVVSQKGLQSFVAQVSVAELTSRIHSLTKAMETVSGGQPPGGSERALMELDWLRDILIAPIENLFPGSAELVLVPDKVLFEVPFSALYNSAVGKFLVEEHVVEICPSGSMFAILHDIARRKSRVPLGDVLVFGDPAFDRSIFYHLPRLPESAVEAREIATLFEHSNLLLGKDATDTQLIDLAKSSSVIHFGGHSLDSSRSDLSMLLLAPDLKARSTGIVSALNVSRIFFRDTRLVVLAGCGTASGRSAEGEGPMSMARAFIAAGVPSVIGSLWNVPSSAQVLKALYSDTVMIANPAAALRKAQLEAISKRQGIGSWSVFELVGE